jgi:DNA-binding NarL/FixJ family response regulator
MAVDAVPKWHYFMVVEGFTSLDTAVTIIGCEKRRLLNESTPSPKIRVLLVEDHEMFRRFICSKIQQQTNFQIIGELEDGLQAVEQAEALQPDVILLDIGLPRLDGITAARRIRNVAPKAKIIFVTQESSEEVVEEAFDLGAWGYVLKAQTETELVAAIDAVSNGQRFLGSGLEGTDNRLRREL